MAGEVIDKIEPLQIVAEAVPIHLIRNRHAAYFFDLLDPAGQRRILQFFDLASFVEAHWPSLGNYGRGSDRMRHTSILFYRGSDVAAQIDMSRDFRSIPQSPEGNDHAGYAFERTACRKDAEIAADFFLSGGVRAVDRLRQCRQAGADARGRKTPGDGGARRVSGRLSEAGSSIPSAALIHSATMKLPLPKSKTMNFGVIVFPGSNCDHDAWYAVQQNLGQTARFIWHDSRNLGEVDAVILPGGFSYGDYLRCGAIAKFSPVMAAVRKFAAEGGPVIGICNGFQILVECGLLPGALLRNAGTQSVCRDGKLRTETTDSPYTSQAAKGQVLRLPIAHGEGRYYADQRTLDELAAEDRIAFRYLDNPNGSLDDIAGVLSRERNVLGLMPHPERATESLMGSTDGLVILRSIA